MSNAVETGIFVFVHLFVLYVVVNTFA